MTLPKEKHGISQESRYNNAPEAMVESGQTSHPSHATSTSPFNQDARNQDTLEAMPKSEGRISMAEPLSTILQNKAAKVVDHESNTMQDSNTIMQQQGWTKDNDCDTSASQLSEYGANNLLFPPLVEPLQRPSTPVRVSEPMDEAPETPNTGNVIQPLVKNYVPPQVTQLGTFKLSRLTQYDPLSTFNTKKWVDPAPMQFQHHTVKRTFMAYLAVQISVNNPSGKKGIPNVRESLSLFMDQVKILLENLQMVDPSVIFLPHKAKDRVGVESDLIATEEHVHDNYDFMRKYFAQLYVHKHDTYMYSNVIMAFNTPQKELLRESSNIFYGEHHAMYPRELQVENCVIVGSFLYSHRDIQGKMLMELFSHLSGYHMTARWKVISKNPEGGKEILRRWHVETDEKDKKQVTRFLESMYNTNHRKLFPLG
jgi:hypothetical protein